MTEEEIPQEDMIPLDDDDVSSQQIDDMMNRANQAEARNIDMGKAMDTMSSGMKDSNFLHLQISTDELLEKLEHFYRGDYQGVDDLTGDLVWKTQTDKDLVTFNEFGITSMMDILSKYIDKNTILSSYTEQRIYEILGDVGDEIILFIQCNYAKMGMDTYFKKTKFRLIVVSSLNIIETTYRRSLRGKTLEELNQAKVIGQFGNAPPQMHQQERKKHWYSGLIPS